MEVRIVQTENILESLEKINKISNEEWLASLSLRKCKELEFHNRDRDVNFKKEAQLDQDTFEKFYGNRKYYTATKKSKIYIEQWLAKNTPGKICLDYACGNGELAIKMAQLGAKLAIGLDISNVSIENASYAAKVENVTENTRFIQADAENTLLPDNSIDVIICSGMLHHLDLSYAFPELRRILSPGGKILAIEALDYNPFIKLYRTLTPSMRTEWEKAHILSMKDVDFASRFFDVGEIKFWHVVSYIGGKFPSLLPLLEKIDTVLTCIPGVRLLAWIFSFELLKRDES